MKHTQGELEILELDAPLDDWTGARFVIRHAENAPGGTALILGGLGRDEEMANARLYATSPKLLDLAKGYARFLETNPGEFNDVILERVRAIIAETELQ